MNKVEGVIGGERGRESQLTEITGKVVFTESNKTGYGSCRELKLDTNHQRPIWWQDQAKTPMHIRVGDYLRGFYKNTPSNAINLEAYEILDPDNNVLDRGIIKGNNWIE